MLAHDLATLVASIDWNAIIVALITLSGVIFNGLLALYIATHVRTPSGTKIGTQVEDMQHITIVNRHMLVRLAKELGVKPNDPQLRALVEEGEAERGK